MPQAFTQNAQGEVMLHPSLVLRQADGRFCFVRMIMSRRKKNIPFEESIIRIAAAFEHKEFGEWFKPLITLEMHRGYGIATLWEDKHQKYDAEKRRTAYWGLYYDLRELCQHFDLKFPEDAEILFKILQEANGEPSNAIFSFENLNPVAPYQSAPSKEQWSWFRVWQKGLALP